MKIITSLIVVIIMSNANLHAQKGSKWTNKVYKISGDWAIEKIKEDRYFVLSDNFVTNVGPDLKLYLTKVKMANIKDRDSVDKEGLFVAELKSNKGAQRYKLPKEINLSDYNSLVIHCKAYSVVWGGIEL